MSTHLNVLPPPVAGPAVARWRRWLVVGLVALAAAMMMGSYVLPWWTLKLYAPQYPHGLKVTISLTGLTGDVSEINELNHYIGMAKLESAAVVERRIGAYLIGVLIVVVMGAALLLGKKTNWMLWFPATLFPVGFIIDNLYWLHRFGTHLDPHAALKIPPFTPELFGNGEIGQFRTFATPAIGFWIVILAVGLLLASTFLRGRVCRDCSRAGTCGAVCSTAFLGKEIKSS